MKVEPDLAKAAMDEYRRLQADIEATPTPSRDLKIELLDAKMEAYKLNNGKGINCMKALYGRFTSTASRHVVGMYVCTSMYGN